MLRYRLDQIKTEHFLFKPGYVTGAEYLCVPQFSLRASEEKCQILVQLWMVIKMGDIEFVDYKLSCVFGLPQDSWEALMNDEKIVLPKFFVEHLMAQVIGIARGVLHAKTEGTIYNGVFIPTVDLTNVVQGDSITLTRDNG